MAITNVGTRDGEEVAQLRRQYDLDSIVREISMTTSPSGAFKGTVIASWILRAVIAVLFLFAGFMKLSGKPMMVQEFAVVGLRQWFRYFTGGVEWIGALCLLIPATSVIGAALLLLVDIGAFIAQISVIHQDWVHTIVIGAVLVLILYLQRGRS